MLDTKFVDAVSHLYLDTTEEMLIKGENPNSILEYDLTFLHFICEYPHGKFRSYFPNGKARMDYMFSPTMEANRAHMVKLLVKYGANVNAFTSNGKTPLLHNLHAVDLSYATIKALVDCGADINWRTYSNFPLTREDLKRNLKDLKEPDGLGPIHIAAKRGNLRLVKYFLSLGANPTICAVENNPGYLHFKGDAYDCARDFMYDDEVDKKEIMEILFNARKNWGL